MAKKLEELLPLMFTAHPWHGIDPGDPKRITAYIEISPEDPVKWELDKPSGLLKVDRVQRTSSLPPCLYGFIPRSYCAEKVAARTKGKAKLGDGDPMDVCVLGEAQIPKGAFLLHARPIGGLRMIDRGSGGPAAPRKGGRPRPDVATADDKIVCVLETDLVYGDMKDIGEVASAIVDRLRHYFLSYKRMPGETKKPTVDIAEVYGAAEARATIEASLADYRAHFGAPETRIAELKRLLVE